MKEDTAIEETKAEERMEMRRKGEMEITRIEVKEK